MVEDNDIAVSFSKRFDNGEPDYQLDTRWWELAKQADERVLTGGSPPGPAQGGGSSGPLGGRGAAGSNGDGANASESPSTGATSPPSPPRAALLDLSQLYVEELTNQRFDVRAFAVDPTDPGLPATTPWAIWKTTAGPWEFLVRSEHVIFNSITLTPLDALLAQLAWQASDFGREQGLGVGFPQILSGLRKRYAKRFEIDPQTLSREAERQLKEAAKSAVGRVSRETATGFFDSLGSNKEQILVTMARRGVVSPQEAIADGRYLQYSSPATIRDFIIANLELFMDGAYWDEVYSTLDFGWRLLLGH